MAGRLTQADPPWLASQLERAASQRVFFSSEAFRPAEDIDLLLLYPRGGWTDGIRFYGRLSPGQPRGTLMTPADAWQLHGTNLGYERTEFFEIAQPMLKGGGRDVIWVVALDGLNEHDPIMPVQLGLNAKASQMTKALTAEQAAAYLQLIAAEPGQGGGLQPPPGKSFRVATVSVRLGQPRFRAALMNEFGGRCSVTGCEIEETLQAAHIVPYTEEPTFMPEAGILLRADIHNLFDLHLLAIRADGSIVCHPRIEAKRETLGLRSHAILPNGERAGRRQQNLSRHLKRWRSK